MWGTRYLRRGALQYVQMSSTLWLDQKLPLAPQLATMGSASNFPAFFILSIFLLAGMMETIEGLSDLTNPDLDVTCMEDSIYIALNESGKIALTGHDLRIGNSNCTLYSNGSHLLVNMSLNGCGLEMEDDGVYLIFSNEIVSYNDTTALIVREPLVEIGFFCKYPKQSNVTLEFSGHRPPVNFTERGFGTFSLQFEFFKSVAYNQVEDPNSYPLEFTLGDMMYMQIESFSSIPNTELFAESCTAAPTDVPGDRRIYQILQDGCDVDETVEIYANGNSAKVQFAMKAFKFIGMHDQVFITCSTILCKAGVSGSRCSQGCVSRSKREAPALTDDDFLPTEEHKMEDSLLPFGKATFLSGAQRRKRDNTFHTSHHVVSQGPVRLRAMRSVTNQETHEPGHMNPNLEMMLGSFLAAVAMVCGVLIYRSRKLEATYERMV